MSMKPIKLENKLTVNGKEVTSVTLDFSKLTGRDLIKAEAEVRADGESHLTRGAWIEIKLKQSKKGRNNESQIQGAIIRG